MGKYYFYTDPSTLNTQTTGGSFGPKGVVSGKDVYRTTTSFVSNSTSPAIAVCNGTICFQADDSGTYTIILKPDDQPTGSFPRIKYFLYKGVTLSSILASGLIDSNSTFSMLYDILSIWSLDNVSNTSSNARLVLGLDYTGDYPTTASSKYKDLDPIDHIFFNPKGKAMLPRVTAGDEIAFFDNGFVGFQIVLEKLGHGAKLLQARKREYKIEVDELSLTPTNADIFQHWHAKQPCLNFMDPCAFYGSLPNGRVYYKKAGIENSENLYQKIFDEILIKFLSPNTIYLDIRNDFGFSLNYFQNYGEKIAFFISVLKELDTTRSGWPILTLEKSDFPTTAHTVAGKFLKTKLRMPKQNNEVPLLYLSRAILKKPSIETSKKSQFPFSNAFDGETYSSGIDLAFPLVSSGGSDELCSSYYKINFYDMELSAPRVNRVAPSREYLLNGLFRPIDMQHAIDIRGGQHHQTVWHEEVLVNLSKRGLQPYIANVGIARDATHTTFFAIPVHYLNTGWVQAGLMFLNGRVTPSSPVTESKKSAKKFIESITGIGGMKYGDYDIKTQSLPHPDTLTPIDVVRLQTLAGKASRKEERFDELIFVMMSNSEYADHILQIKNHTPDIKSLPTYLSVTNIESRYSGLSINKITLNASGYVIGLTNIDTEIVPLNMEMFEYNDY